MGPARALVVVGSLLVIAAATGCAQRVATHAGHSPARPETQPPPIRPGEPRQEAGRIEAPAALRSSTDSSGGPGGVTTGARIEAAGPPAGAPGFDIRVNQDLTARFQNETTAATNPNDAQQVVAAWNDNLIFDPSTNLQRSRIAYGWSADGGSTWQSTVPDFATVDNKQSADAALVFDGLGNAYLVFLPYDQVDRSAPELNQILVARSSDGGATYAEPVLVDSGGVDKPYITADPVSNEVHVFWTRTGGATFEIFHSKSTDQGATFTAPVRVSDPGRPSQGSAPGVAPDGAVVIAWTDQSERVFFDRSTDGGATWGLDVLVADGVVPPRSPLVGNFRNPLNGALAVDRSGGPFDGRLYIVWPDQRFGDPDILLSYSADDGATWSAPLRVNDDAQGNDADQFFPWVARAGTPRPSPSR